MALYCRVDPTLTLPFSGATAIPVRTAFTVKPVEPLMEFEVAVMVADPPLTPLASPPLLMVAILASEEDQVTLAVMSFVVPSL